MTTLNRVIIIGNLCREVQLRFTGSQKAVANFTLATNDYRKGPDGKGVETSEFHKVCVWGKQAESCSKYLTKGKSVMVEGRLQTKAWDNKEGQKQYTTEIVANNVQFLGSPQKSDSNDKIPDKHMNASKSQPVNDLDDIPF